MGSDRAETGRAVLVTGGTGFIGSRVTRALLARGVAVVCFDSRPEPLRLGADARHCNLSIVEGDITMFDDVVSVLSASSVEAIIHTAALLGARLEAEPRLAVRVNIGGTTNVFEAATVMDVRRVVYASTMVVHGDQRDHGDVDIDEDAPLFPRSVYAYTKLLNEVLAQAYHDRFGLDTRGLRICTPFGLGREQGGGAGGAVTRMIVNPARGLPARIDISPADRTPCIYVEDVAEILVRLALGQNLTRPVYLCSATAATLAELAEIVKETLPEAVITFADGAGEVEHIDRVKADRLEADISYHLPSLRTRVRDLITLVREAAPPAVPAVGS